MRSLAWMVMMGLMLTACSRDPKSPGMEGHEDQTMQMVFEHVVTKQYHHGDLRFIMKSPRVVLDESSRTVRIQGGVWTRLHNPVWEEQSR